MFAVLWIVKPLQPFLSIFGVGAGSFGVYQAVQADNPALAIYRSILAAAAAGALIKPLLTGTPSPPVPPPRPWAVNLLSPSRVAHVLEGHLFPGKPGKTPFPRGWSPAKILHEVSDIATDPTLTWKQQTGPAGSWFTKAGAPARFFVVGTRNGVTIKVIIEPAGEGIITGFPIN